MEKGSKHTEETKQKLREINLGKKLSKETKEKIRLKSKGRRHTEESKEKIRQFNLGKKYSEETKRKIGLAHKGKKISEKTRKKISLAFKGKHHSEESKKKMSLAQKGKKHKPLSEEHKQKLVLAHLGKKMSEEIKNKISESHKKRVLGGKCHLWKGGISPINKIIRQSMEYRLWRESVFARDNWTCQKTGVKNGNGKTIYLHPHHIQNFAQFPELRFALDNGITLSKEAHKEFHHIYGTKHNTKEQLIEFLNKII